MTELDPEPASTNPVPAESSWWSKIEPRERAAVGWATGWFYCILLGYLIVRPVRETMGSIGGTKQLQYMMLATFVAMLAAVPLYSMLVAKLPRRWLVRVAYHFFAASLVTFFLVMQSESEPVRIWSARIFFVWVNVFAFFATSVFWSVLADLFSSSQGKRLFGFIAAGGTAGAITGSIITGQLAGKMSTSTLLLLPALILEIGLCCAWRLDKQASSLGGNDSQSSGPTDRPTGGGVLAGISHVMHSPYLAIICVFLLFAQACGTQLYFQQAEIVAAEIESKEARTQLFAHLDLGAQVLTLVLQVLLSGVILRRLGVSVALVILPVIYLIGFASLASNPALTTLIVTMIATRAFGYGIAVPAREVLFTVVSREEKYKSKSFIDTVVLRGGDAASGQLFGWLRSLEISVTTMNWFAVPITAVWAVVAWNLGRRQQQLAQPKDKRPDDS